MVKNIVILGGNSHPQLVTNVCNILGIPPCNRILTKFEVGESRCEIKDSVRGKDVYIIQSGSGRVNDNFIDLCIMISACKTGSAKRVTAVLPLFPYSRQPDLPYNKVGAPLSKAPTLSASGTLARKEDYTFESVPATPGLDRPKSAALTDSVALSKALSKTSLMYGTAARTNGLGGNNSNNNGSNGINGNDNSYFRPGTASSAGGGATATATGSSTPTHIHAGSTSSQAEAAAAAAAATASTAPPYTTHDYDNHTLVNGFQAKPGYKKWVAQAGILVADLLTCAGADHVITMDLHDPQYQGFFDVPVDNLYGKPLLQRYIQQHIPEYRDAVIVSPDAGGAKRATAIADSLGVDFALIHKERRPTKITDRQNATMMLVGNVTGRVCILVDDLADTANTITRAAKLLKREGATYCYALLTHGVLSGDAIPRINASALDKIIVTNSVPQTEHRTLCPKLEVLDISPVFAEAIRRVHHGESISVLFQYD
ncbi:Ribose-phosphate diphosphokinase [Niveomyces insectorum RCEF 264]|uniref:Ribose-phosphate diphosphokinase n=1 Tax=Niveomyces insectorum RCEF 264 TaxID=1081102 RepID=A0A167Z8P7_9HYPO|nr:Ribose-phosphate diphosphokinase [Niveomyces insectorum RCEF 264]